MTRLLTRQRLPLVCVIAMLCLTAASSAQSPQAAPATPYDVAARALNDGRYAEVAAILGTLDDPRAIALKARADLARGRNAEAEKLLLPVAAAAPGSDAALELGLLYVRSGRRDEGVRVLRAVVGRSDQDLPADLVRIGRALQALGEPREANDNYFRRANRLDPKDPAVNTAWGKLFFERYDPANAAQSFQEALEVDPRLVEARVGLARAVYESNPPAARAALQQALETNPNSVEAHLFLAEIALDERKRDEAGASIEKALAINPNSLEGRALRGAMAFLEGRTADFEAEAAAILKVHPTYADAYRVAGDHAARNYRFDEAVALTRRALEVDGGSLRAYADLGRHLLRTGDEPGARRALEAAFKGDAFDLHTENLLRLLDELDKFETIRDGDLIVRLHPDEAGVMREQVVPLAREALVVLGKQYQFQPRGPILIEMFPRHDDFAVRTVGIPGFLGALGACFGQVVTLDSPRARPPGTFNWRETLWHEMAHVITLQMSENRLPRWVSEGLSVWEERRARPEWGREMELSFAQALQANRAIKLSELNDGFADPRLISLAYYQASLVVEHLAATYGDPALHQFIRAYGRGLETDEALKTAFNITVDQLQVTFDQKVAKDFAQHREALKAPEMPGTPTLEALKLLAESTPGSFAVQMELAQALHESGDGPAAIEALERASALLPSATGSDNPNALIALIATERGDTARAIQAFEALVKVDHSDVESARKLAALLEGEGGGARALAAARIVADLDPFDAAAQSKVGRAALESRDAELAVRSLRSALASNPPDRAGIHLDLGEAYFLAGRLDDAKTQALAALEIAPSFERAQDLLLKIVGAQPRQ